MALPSTTPDTIPTNIPSTYKSSTLTPGYNTQASYTELPDWYNQATSNAVNLGLSNATAANNAANNANQNIAGAVNNLNEGINTQTGNLNQIATGAANPWLANGQPNTQTAFGQLFQNQQNQLNAQIPDIQAGADAAGIASGNFGGLRGLTAGNTARTKAANDLAVQQSQAWNQAQTTGINAANTAVNAGQTGVQGALSAGNFGVNAPLNVAGALGNLLSGTKVGSSNYTDPSNFQLNQFYNDVAAQQAANNAGGSSSIFNNNSDTPVTLQNAILNNGGVLQPGGGTVFKRGGPIRRYAPGGALPVRPNRPRPQSMGNVPPEEIQRMRDEQQQRMTQQAYQNSQFQNQQQQQPSILDQIFMGGRK